MNLTSESIEGQEAGYTEEMKIGIDTAASELLTADKQYDLNFKAKNNDGSQVLSGCVPLAA